MTKITLLDGSIGQELVRRVGDRPTPLWSTSVMLERPELVRAVHSEYFQAGATIATTNTYAVHRDRLPFGNIEHKFEELIDTALAEAETARDVHGYGRIAASLGPLVASYRPDLSPPPDEAAPLYHELAEQMKARADLFLIETMSSVDQAEGALLGLAGCGKPIWLGFTVMDDDGSHLRSGESVSDLSALVDAYKPDAILVHCSRPEAISAALELIKPMGRPFGAYANGFTRISAGFLEDMPTVDALEARVDLSPETYADSAI